MKCAWLAFIFYLLSGFYYHAQAQDSSRCAVRVSLLTCAPGQELYSVFGHTALRVIDSLTHTDVVYNYGTFKFNDPDFYIKFVRGRLEYFLSADDFNDFLKEYQAHQRSVTEQVLNLTCAQKKQVTQVLYTNMQTANRAYKYNFLYENCTTRVRDLLFNSVTDSNIEKPVINGDVTSRNLLHAYLDADGEPWSKLCIDILLGSKLDKKIDNRAAMFLPDYLSKGADSAQLADNKLFVVQKHFILNMPSPVIGTGKYVPFTVIAFICAALFFISVQTDKGKNNLGYFIDSFLLYITGLVGLLLLFMWIGTDHTVCKNNFNLVWALPTNIVTAFFLWRNPLWLRRYFYFALAINAMLLACWFWLPQDINIAIAPLVILLLFRYAKLAQRHY